MMKVADYVAELSSLAASRCDGAHGRAIASRLATLSATSTCSDVLSVERDVVAELLLAGHDAKRAVERALMPLWRAAFSRSLSSAVLDPRAFDELRCALSLSDGPRAAMALAVRLEDERRERERPVIVAREREEHARRMRDESARQERQRDEEWRRIGEARALARRQRAVGVISTLAPSINVPHRRDACGYRDCAERCPDTIQGRAPRSREFAAWTRAQVAALGTDVVGYVAGVSLDLDRGPRRPITSRLLVSRGDEWLEWAACSVVDLVADDGMFVVLADNDLGVGERAAIALAEARGIRVDVRRLPC